MAPPTPADQPIGRLGLISRQRARPTGWALNVDDWPVSVGNDRSGAVDGVDGALVGGTVRCWRGRRARGAVVYVDLGPREGERCRRGAPGGGVGGGGGRAGL